MGRVGGIWGESLRGVLHSGAARNTAYLPNSKKTLANRGAGTPAKTWQVQYINLFRENPRIQAVLLLIQTKEKER